MKYTIKKKILDIIKREEITDYESDRLWDIARMFRNEFNTMEELTDFYYDIAMLIIEPQHLSTEIETFLPNFAGFYNTLYEMDIDNVLEDYNNERDTHVDELKDMGYDKDHEVTYDDLEIDYNGYMHDIAIRYTDFIEGKLSKYVDSITFQKIVSPREYNFSNDIVNVVIDLKVKAVQRFFNDNNIIESFRVYLEKTYTSRSGFMSFYSNDVSEWLEEIEDFDNMKDKAHKVGSILEFILLHDDECIIEELEDYYEVMEDVHSFMYCTLKDTKK